MVARDLRHRLAGGEAAVDLRALQMLTTRTLSTHNVEMNMGILIKRKGNCGSGNDRPKVIRYRQKSGCSSAAFSKNSVMLGPSPPAFRLGRVDKSLPLRPIESRKIARSRVPIECNPLPLSGSRKIPNSFVRNLRLVGPGRIRTFQPDRYERSTGDREKSENTRLATASDVGSRSVQTIRENS